MKNNDSIYPCFVWTIFIREAFGNEQVEYGDTRSARRARVLAADLETRGFTRVEVKQTDRCGRQWHGDLDNPLYTKYMRHLNRKVA